MIDTGIMNGADIVASIALGAKFTLIGRAYLYGLMAGGREGVDRTIAILRSEIERTMTLLGVSSLEELEPQHVTQLTRLVPVAQPAARRRAPHDREGPGGEGLIRTRTGSVGQQPLQVAGGVLPALHRLAGHAEREHGVVVAVRVEPVAEEQHVLERDAGLLGELRHAVGLVDAAVGDVDRRRTARAHLEVGDPRGDRVAQRGLLRAGRVPGGLRVEGRALPERRERDLRAAILEDVAPGLGLPEAEATSLPLDGVAARGTSRRR